MGNVGDDLAAVLVVQQIKARITDLLLKQLDQLGAQALHQLGGLVIVRLQYDPAALEQKEKIAVMEFHFEIGAGKEHKRNQWQHGAVAYINGAGAHLLLVDKKRCLEDGHLRVDR